MKCFRAVIDENDRVDRNPKSPSVDRNDPAEGQFFNFMRTEIATGSRSEAAFDLL